MDFLKGLYLFLLSLGRQVNEGMSETDLLEQAGKVPASGSPVPAVYLEKAFADAATGDTTITLPFKCKVVDTSFLCNSTNGTNANTVQVCAAASGASPVTDAMSTNGKVAGDLVRAVTITAANATFAQGAKVYINRQRIGGALAGTVRLTLIPVA